MPRAKTAKTAKEINTIGANGAPKSEAKPSTCFGSGETSDNGPAFQCRVGHNHHPSPEGTVENTPRYHR
jgi:hypothetical protein